MLPRRLEPEVMDTPEEAVDYDAMDHREVNRAFVDDFLGALRLTGFDGPETLKILDAGTGTAQIPIELVSRFVSSRGTQPVSLDGHITAIDLAGEMLKVAERNVAAAGFGDFIRLERVDCKALPYADVSFDAVISNSIVHHIPQPETVLAEMWRVLRTGGVLFVRDLLRPPDEETLDRLVHSYAGDENAHQQQMFRDSLHAALTLPELHELLERLGLPPQSARQTTDRHWTLCAVR